MNAERIFLAGAIALVAAGLVLAFLFIGTPRDARIAALDARRVDDLLQIAVALGNRYGDEDIALPPRLPRDIARSDPTTNRPYEYRRLSARDYELCVIFYSPSPRGENAGDEITPLGRVWRHGAGRTCYKINDKHGDVDPEIIEGISR